MASSSFVQWHRICIPQIQLNLEVLGTGQSFRWRVDKDNVWTGVMKDTVWRLRQDDNYLYYQILEFPSSCVSQSPEEKLRDYFQLHIDVDSLYQRWRMVDVQIDDPCDKFPAVRVLRQDPIEALFAFICSSNNNIKRISNMVLQLCEKYGDSVVGVDNVTYFNFPKVDRLTPAPTVSANNAPAPLAGPVSSITTTTNGTSSSEFNHEQQHLPVETTLRACGFGYRAPFIVNTAAAIQRNGGEAWIRNLRNQPYEQAKRVLETLPGVGAKVADCVCLMALDKAEAVPIDTHIWNVTTSVYMGKAAKSSKTLTPKVYKTVGDFYRNLFGPYAGWATTVLFMSDLMKKQTGSSRKTTASSGIMEDNSVDTGYETNSGGYEWEDESITCAADLAARMQEKRQRQRNNTAGVKRPRN